MQTTTITKTMEYVEACYNAALVVADETSRSEKEKLLSLFFIENQLDVIHESLSARSRPAWFNLTH